MPRRFITKVDIDELLAAGQRTLEVASDTTLTDHAAEYARTRGVTITRSEAPAKRAQASPHEDHAAVRSAVIAALGTVPAGLDDAIGRVLGEH